MANFNLHKVTTNSWIANTNGSPVAFIHRGEDHFLFMTPEGSQKFPNLNAVKEFLGGKVKEQITEASDGLDSSAENEIDGFPVKHTTIAVEQGGDRPVYTRGGGKVQHVAGYWTIKFSKRWVPSFCPMLKTVEQYQSAGPFKTRMEMMTNMAALNRADS